MTGYRKGKPKECKELTCSHPRCAHGRPHCPTCPAPGTARRVNGARCAGCSSGVVPHGSNVCKRCADRGIEADPLFEVPS